MSRKSTTISNIKARQRHGNHRRSNNWFDINKYGYTASKVDTHAASIQATIDAAAAAKGGTVVLPAGEYVLDKPLRIESSVIAVVGANRATKITVTDVNLIPFYITGSDVSLAGLEFTHAQPGPGDVTGHGSCGCDDTFGLGALTHAHAFRTGTSIEHHITYSPLSQSSRLQTKYTLPILKRPKLAKQVHQHHPDRTRPINPQVL